MPQSDAPYLRDLIATAALRQRWRASPDLHAALVRAGHRVARQAVWTWWSGRNVPGSEAARVALASVLGVPPEDVRTARPCPRERLAGERPLTERQIRRVVRSEIGVWAREQQRRILPALRLVLSRLTGRGVSLDDLGGLRVVDVPEDESEPASSGEAG